MKFFFLLTLIAISFTNCTKIEIEPETEPVIIPPSDLYVGNYTVTETRTYTNTYTSQQETSTEQFLITVNKVDAIIVEVIGFANCINSNLKANASATTLVVTDSPPIVCGVAGTYQPPSSIIITKTTDGFSFTYNGEHRLYDPSGSVWTVVPITMAGTAIKS
ncbi:MAG: hypothetical protein ACI976_001295 [Aureispira sp.]|jgi:hypothetical protein